MDSKIKQLAAGIALAGALTVGTAGVAFAADSSSNSTSAPSAQTAGHPGIRAEFRRGAVKDVAETLGVSRADLRTALKGGQTISEYAKSLGHDPKDVVDALTTAANTKLAQLVTDGRFSQSQADNVTSKLGARINTLMNHDFSQHASA